MAEADATEAREPSAPHDAARLGRAFGLLWGGSTLTLFVEQYISFAIPLMLVSRVGTSISVAQFATFLFFLPYLAIGLNAGVWLEGKSHKRSLTWSTAAQLLMLVLLLAFVAASPHSAWPYIVFILASGAAAVFFQISFQSIIPRLWRDEGLLYEANSRLALSDAIMRVLGPAAAGVLIGLLTPEGSTMVVAIATLLAVALFSAVPSPPNTTKSTPAALRTSTTALIRQGLRFVHEHKWLNPIIYCGAFYIVFITATKITVALYLVEGRGQSSVKAGLSISSIALGYAIGSQLGKRQAQRSGPRRTLQIGAAIASLGASGAAIIVTFGPDRGLIPATVLALTLHGVGDGMFAPVALAVRQKETPDELMSRVTAVHRFFIWGGMSLGGLLAAVTTFWGSAPTTLGICAVFTWGTLPILYRRALRLDAEERR